MATLNIQTATKGVYSINLQTTPPAVGPYVTVQGENTDVYYAPAIKTFCGPIAVQVNDCGPTSGCWPVRRLTNAVLEHYLICRVCGTALDMRLSRDCFEYGPVDVTIYPPRSGCYVGVNMAPEYCVRVDYAWAIANNIWYTSTAMYINHCGVDTNCYSAGPWPAGLGYAAPDACGILCDTVSGAESRYSCSSYFTVNGYSSAVQLCVGNGAGGPNNDIHYTSAASIGYAVCPFTGWAGLTRIIGGWCSACYGTGWIIANTSCWMLACHPMETNNLVPYTPSLPRATVLCNIMPTGNADVCLCFNSTSGGYQKVSGLACNPNRALAPSEGFPWTCSVLSCAIDDRCHDLIGGNGCIFMGVWRNKTGTLTSEGNVWGWLNNQLDTNAPTYTPDPYHTDFITDICGWRYVEPTP